MGAIGVISDPFCFSYQPQCIHTMVCSLRYMSKRLFYLIVCSLFCAAASVAGTVVLSQEAITGSADYGSGTGQSILVPPMTTITGVALHIDNSGGGAGGGSLRVDLWHAKRGGGPLSRSGVTPITSGTLLKADVEGQPPGWFSITFDTGYENSSSSSVELIFDFELLTSGASGWNEYSFSNQNPDATGSLVYWSDSTASYTESSTEDLAYRILGETPQFSYDDLGSEVEITAYLGSDLDVVIPAELDGKAVAYIAKEIFYESVTVRSVQVPDSVLTIENGAFVLPSSLETILVDGSNPNYSSEDGMLFNKLKTTLIRCPDRKSGSYSIPETVTTVGQFAFQYCTLLTGVTIPDSVTVIGGEAFYACTLLKTITIPSSVTSLGSGAFNSSGLESIIIPNGISRLETRTFQNCGSLSSVTLPSSVTTISSYVFYGCTSLEQLAIPSSVLTIGASAFYNCSALESLVFTGDAPNLVNSVFSGNPASLVLYYDAAATGFDAADYDSLTTVAYQGPAPDSEFTRWLARSALRTDRSATETFTDSDITLLEGYALNLNTSQSLGPQMPMAVVAGDELNVTFYAAREDVSYIVEWSLALGDWQRSGITETAPDLSGNRTATIDVADKNSCFIHLIIDGSGL